MSGKTDLLSDHFRYAIVRARPTTWTSTEITPTGLHASISIHICADYLDQNTGEWAPNLQCFVNRIATNPERLANVYFDTVLLLRAIARAAPYLEAYDIETAQSKNDAVGIEADKKVREQLRAVLDMARDSGASAFDEKALFNGDDALVSRFGSTFTIILLSGTDCSTLTLFRPTETTGITRPIQAQFQERLEDLGLYRL